MFKKIVKALLKKAGYEIYHRHFYDFNDLNTLGRIFPAESKITIFDVGANVGQTIKRFKSFWPNSKIYSFEPDPEVFQLLQKNTKDLSDAHVFNIGLGNKNETKTFFRMPDSGSSSFIPLNKNSKTYSILNQEDNLKHHNKTTLKRNAEANIKCTISTLDSFCSNNSIEHINILKMDVQGYEPHVLKGASDLLAQNKIDVILTEIMFSDYYEERRSISDIENIINDKNFVLYDIPYLARVPTNQEQRLFFIDAIYANKTYLTHI